MTTLQNFRPLLAATLDTDEDVKKLSYPLAVSPKVDGIRTLIHPTLGPVTRSLKPIPNKYIRTYLNDPRLYYLDGEIVVGEITAPDVFNRTTSGVMSEGGTPDFTYYVFDSFHNVSIPYELRYQTAVEVVHDYRALALGCSGDEVGGFLRVNILEHSVVNDYDNLCIFEEGFLDLGYEGLMTRNLTGHYKFGRSTLRQEILCKLKRFKDDEATVTGFEPLERNRNPAIRNVLGLLERSSHQANKQAEELLGTLIVAHHSYGTFGIGSGFDTAQRQEIWQNRDKYLGKTVNFKFQEVGAKDAPRFPIFKGFRKD